MPQQVRATNLAARRTAEFGRGFSCGFRWAMRGYKLPKPLTQTGRTLRPWSVGFKEGFRQVYQ